MTMPSGAAGLDTLFSPFGQTNTLTDLAGFTQGNITQHFMDLLQGNTTLTGASTQFFDVILGGFQSITNFLDLLVNAITGGVGGLSGISTFLTARWNDLTHAFDLIQQIIDKIVNAVTGGLSAGNPISGVFDAIAGLLGIGKNAQSSADTANTQIALLNAAAAAGGVPGGISITDDFNRPSAIGLGADYDQAYLGSGSGTQGTDGAGNAHWTASGFFQRQSMNRYQTTALATDTQMASFVLPWPCSRNFNTNTVMYVELRLRMNAAQDTYVTAGIFPGYVEIGYWVAGVYTRLGAQETVAMANGDLWEFRAGVGANARQFRLLRNGLTVCDRIESGTTSVIDPANRYVGFAASAGVDFFFIFAQIPAPDIAVFSAADRAA